MKDCEGKLDAICSRLIERFGDQGKGAAEELKRWLSDELPLTCPDEIRKHLDESHLDLLFDAFWQTLPFGTGGRRGPVGYGPNRMNFTTVAMTVQGHCHYLKKQYPDRDDLAVVVANDVRIFKDIAGRYRFLDDNHPLIGESSRSLARLACEVYAGNGIRAYICDPNSEDAVLSTPMLSYCIGELGAVGGINLSASHNPPDDNGIKVYDSYGSQPIAPDDQHLVDAMSDVGELKTVAFDEALAADLVRAIPEDTQESYVETYVRHYANVYRPDQSDPVIVYSPLCGCGITSCVTVLERLGFKVATPPDQGPDGTFASIPLKAPNPEVPQSTKPAKEYADSVGADLVLCSDPDADRIGLEAKLQNGEWHHFDGNQIAAILTYFLMLDPDGPRRKGLVIETLVTTRIIEKIVERAGQSHFVGDLLVGFKYVADVLKALDADGKYQDVECSSDDLVLATEESHGVLVVPTIRDKDSTPACIYLAAIYQIARRKGQTLLDYYAGILDDIGEYDSVGRSVMMVGTKGMQRKDIIMSAYRESPPATLAGLPVKNIVDYWDEEAHGPFKSETDKLPRNVLQITTDEGIITIRPSGTEPKVKFYIQLLPFGEPSSARGLELLDEIRHKANSFASRIYNEMLAVIDIKLSDAALLLPDIVDLDRKVDFDTKTVPQLRKKLSNGGFTSLEVDLLPWLREHVAAMTPGADPLPAVKLSLAAVCADWQEEMRDAPCFSELAAWCGLSA